MNEPQDKDQAQHWLVRPATIRWLWRIFGVVLALTVAAQWFIEPHGYFGVDGTFGFNAWFGFLACVVMVVVAKLLGYLVKRPESYYEDRNV
ncbi:hypothetical protein [Wenzhouxiangella sp. XN24]|uniref:hypothetical protein n=1 Tax=Wenzhouxiangella sp. XN24 TaxID=2713569 RepID=UPI0019822C1E|nr:hypothetical protein [Wenzhouxiangella sp. XN24]